MNAAATGDGLRLAVFTDTALPQMNGVSRTLDRLLSAVEGRGGRARLFTTTDPEVAENDVAVRFRSLPFWAYPQLRLAVPPRSAVAAQLSSWGATLVHAATPFGVGLAGRRAALDLGLPFVTSYHTSLTAYASFYRLGALVRPGWAFLRWFHNSGARTYCPTRAVESELRGHGFRNTAIWSRGIDTARFSPQWRSASMRARLGAGDQQLVLACVGRLAAEKGLDVALHAMHQLERDQPGRWRFVFAGDGPYAAHCRAAAPSNALFLGQIVGDELSALYASADVFAFPSTTDTFGNVLLEAMASGLAVVAADVRSTREVLDESGGVLFAAGDSASLAAELRALAENPERRQAVASSALTAARGRNWAHVFDSLIADYEKVIVDHTTHPERLTGRPPAGAREPFRAGTEQ